MFLLSALYYFLSGFYLSSFSTPPISDSLKKESIEVLRSVMNTQQEWVKVHAAEYLLWSGHPEGVQKTYLEEEKKWDTVSRYRIGIWRVLYQAAARSSEKEMWLHKIMDAFLDTAGADRIHAAETLAKLHVSPLKENPAVTEAALKSPVSSLALYTRWSVSFTSIDSSMRIRKSFLDIAISPKEEVASRNLAAYVLRNSGELPLAEWRVLAASALSAASASDIRMSLLNAAVITAPQKTASTDLYREVYRAFLQYKDNPAKSVRIDIAAGLGERGQKENLPILIAFLRNKNPTGVDADDADVRATAAYAILKMDKRQKEGVE
ncbi:MAG: hypothetical protein ABI280_01995 [Ginsengibacter sp.]